MEQFFNSIWFDLIMLVVGFVLLIKGADFFVDGSSSIAKKFRIPSIIIGLTVVSLGTSLPELASSVTASLAGSNEIAISNVVGSNLFNLMVVVGFCALMANVSVDNNMLKRDIPISISAAILLLTLCAIGSTLGRIDSAILLVLFVSYIALLVIYAMKNRTDDDEEDEVKERNIILSLVFVIGGIVAIKFGGDFVVNSARDIAVTFGMSETLVGLTIVAVGTSLPELVTSIVAARKNEVDLALGNAIGSNIFNILCILGFTGVISPVKIIPNNLIDIGILIAFSAIIWLVAWKKRKLNRIDGVWMILLYVAFAAFIVIRDLA